MIKVACPVCFKRNINAHIDESGYLKWDCERCGSSHKKLIRVPMNLPGQLYEIWSEGYVATGQRSGAILHGTQRADSFKEACALFFKRDPYFSGDAYWACKLFSEEGAARRSYG